MATLGGDTIRLKLKVVPGASRDAIEGWIGDALKVRVSAAPERGKANAAVERLLATTLGLRRTDVRIVSGQTNARKTIEVDLEESEALRHLPDRP